MSTALSERPGRPRPRRRLLRVSPPAAPVVERSWLRVQRRAMACAFEITLDAADAASVPAAQAALGRLDAIESALTVFRDSSVIVDLNRRAAGEDVTCDAEVFALLERSAALWRGTGGAFDITSTPLSRCWGFLRREGRLPSDREIEDARQVVGMHHVVLDRQRRTVRFLKPGVELNLGAIGKGYALDCLGSILRQRGVAHALLTAGRSSLLAIGGRGRGWPIDIVSPRCDGALARVWLRDGAALGTSGAGTQFVMVDGTRYGHVLDPRTGRPAAGMLSASVVTPSAADADALSTAFLVGGPLAARQYCDGHAGVMAVLTVDDSTRGSMVIGESPNAEVERG